MSRSHDSAAAVLRRFIEANERQDEAGMRACLTRGSLEGDGFSGPTPANVAFRMGEAEDGEGGVVVIPLTVVPIEDGRDGAPMDELRCRMVEEDGEWRFDLAGTIEAKFAPLEEAMREVGEAMGQALGAMGEALSSAFGGEDADTEVSAFTSEPLEFSTFEEAPAIPTAEEWVDLPEFTALERLTEQVSGVCGRPVEVVCDLDGLLGLFGSEDRATLVPWLDAEFCPGLASAIEVATHAVPREVSRLRRVRIEAALEWMERGLFLDGPDLVYRADLRDPGGWYSGNELAQIIAGVLAGLTEDGAMYPRGRGVVPRVSDWDAAAGRIELFSRLAGPREMGRLCRVTGGPLALDFQWSMLSGSDAEARNLWVWTLGRVVGAARLVYPAGGGESPAPGWLRVVRVGIGFGQKRASLRDGVLEMVVTPGRGETDCFYEHELARVLMGESIGEGEGGEEGD